MTQLTTSYYDVNKAAQLVFFFLKKSSERHMNITKLRLVKWLYLSERASYEEFGEPLTGDKLGALRHGPAPSETLALIEGTSRAFPGNPWKNIIKVDREPKHQYVSLTSNCEYKSIEDLDRFSDAELILINFIWEKYGGWSAKDLESHLHDTNLFPEWSWKEGDGTNWIDIETILKVVGFDEASIEPMVKNIVNFSNQST
ncbi:Panacea domain-containing protein [Simplicispira psychrophila]|uniref:Panacea domain-containing protein n=1 Tax=Simplicispira psychrophila TaxID=80882 RepID=UPI00146FB3C1|nr:Panacea domain-containing protein [Simplicispira psychrophila]